MFMLISIVTIFIPIWKNVNTIQYCWTYSKKNATSDIFVKN